MMEPGLVAYCVFVFNDTRLANLRASLGAFYGHCTLNHSQQQAPLPSLISCSFN